MDLPTLTDTDLNLRHCLLLKADDLFFTLAQPQSSQMRDNFLGLEVEGLADENLSADEIRSINLGRFSIAERIHLLHAMLANRHLSLQEPNTPDTEDARNDALHFVEHFLSTLPTVALGGLDLTSARNREVRQVWELAGAWLSLIEIIECAFYEDTNWLLTVSDLALLSGIDVRTLRNLCGPSKTIRTQATGEAKRTPSDANVFVYLNGTDALDWLRSRKDFRIAPIDTAWITRSLVKADKRNASRGLLISAILNLGPLERIAPAIDITVEKARACANGERELSAHSFERLVHLLTVDPTPITQGSDTMKYIADLSPPTASLHKLLINDPRVEEHPKGHSQYVLRYRTKTGHEIAVEKRVKTPLLYFTRSLADDRLTGFDLEYVPATKGGRNSNLNTLETFRAKPLACLRVNELETARRALDACVSS